MKDLRVERLKNLKVGDEVFIFSGYLSGYRTDFIKKITPTGQILLKCGVRFDPKGFVLGSHHPLKKLSYKDSSNIEVWFGDWHSTKLSGLTASVLPFYNRDKEPVRKKTALRNAMFKVKKESEERFDKFIEESENSEKFISVCMKEDWQAAKVMIMNADSCKAEMKHYLNIFINAKKSKLEKIIQSVKDISNE